MMVDVTVVMSVHDGFDGSCDGVVGSNYGGE